jgi:hypothetical protein
MVEYQLLVDREKTCISMTGRVMSRSECTPMKAIIPLGPFSERKEELLGFLARSSFME